MENENINGICIRNKYQNTIVHIGSGKEDSGGPHVSIRQGKTMLVDIQAQLEKKDTE